MMTPAPWIVDSSPFIGLAKVGLLDLLLAPGRDVLIPDAVEREILAGSSFDLAQQALRQGWGIRIPTPAIPEELQSLTLDAGERATLAVALAHPESVAVLDDSRGRAAAGVLGVTAVGTVGVLLRARQEGQLLALAPSLRALALEGLFLPKEALLTNLLNSVGETWP